MNSLDAYLKSHEKASEFAARVGVSEQYVSFLRRGLRKPSLSMATRIEQATQGKVALSSWINDAPSPDAAAVVPGP